MKFTVICGLRDGALPGDSLRMDCLDVEASSPEEAIMSASIMLGAETMFLPAAVPGGILDLRPEDYAMMLWPLAQETLGQLMLEMTFPECDRPARGGAAGALYCSGTAWPLWLMSWEKACTTAQEMRDDEWILFHQEEWIHACRAADEARQRAMRKHRRKGEEADGRNQSTEEAEGPEGCGRKG